MSLRILIVGACPYPLPQGSQVFMRDHARALQARGHTVQLLVYAHGQGRDHSGLPLHRAPGIPGFHRVKAGPSWAKPLLDLGLAGKLRRIVQREQIDAVIAHNYEALLAGLLAGVRPLLYHAHNAMQDELPYYFRQCRWAVRAGGWLDAAFPRRADHCIVPHQRLAAYLESRGVAASRLSVLPPPVALSDFTEPYYGADPVDIVYTGNLDRYQNLPLLYEAMARLHATEPGLRLHIATHQRRVSVPARPWIAVAHLEDFAAMQAFLARDAVVALPRVSWSGYPVKLLNALAAGRAVVACQGAAHGLEDGVNALVCPDNDVDAFARAMLRLCRNSDLRQRLGRTARARIEAAHSFDAVGEALETVIRRVL